MSKERDPSQLVTQKWGSIVILVPEEDFFTFGTRSEIILDISPRSESSSLFVHIWYQNCRVIGIV